LESIRQVRKNPQLVQQLQANTRYLRSRLLAEGFIAVGETNVIPVIMPEEINPKQFTRKMMEEYGVWVSPIWFVAKPRLRITANALHTQEEMDCLVTAMVATRNAMYSVKEPVGVS
jgi:glycine C-acetyltransferase